MLLPQQLRIILVEPDQARNIGAVIRIAANCGLSKVFMVRQRSLSPDELKDVRLASSGASEIVSLEKCDSIADAVLGTDYVVGTSGRQRTESLPVIAKLADIATPARNSITAFLFGRESTGLTNEELLQCDAQLKLPVNPQFPSMNLAHAVAVVLWDALHSSSISDTHKPSQSDPPARRDLQERWLQQFDLDSAATSQLRQLLRRAEPTSDDMSMMFNLVKGRKPHK